MFPVTVELPLPHRDLGKNGRPTPWRRASLYAAAQEEARLALHQALLAERPEFDGLVMMDIDWQVRPSDRLPDDDNVIGRCAAYRDGAQSYGLVLDDAQIATGSVTIGRGAEQRVWLTFRLPATPAEQDRALLEWVRRRTERPGGGEAELRYIGSVVGAYLGAEVGDVGSGDLGEDKRGHVGCRSCFRDDPDKLGVAGGAGVPAG